MSLKVVNKRNSRLMDYVHRPTFNGGLDSWTPSSLFYSGEAGVWFDPSDLSTVFADNLGTTPAVFGGPVGLILDKSKGGPGPQLRSVGVGVTIGTPPTPSAYDRDTGIGILSRGATTDHLARINFSGFSTSSKYEFDVETLPNEGNIAAEVRGAAGIVLHSFPVGRSRVVLSPDTPSPFFMIVANNATIGVIIHSIREFPGNHATQATATKRPILGRVPKGGRRNLLTYSEDYTNAVWVKNLVTLVPAGEAKFKMVSSSGAVASHHVSQTLDVKQVAFEAGAAEYSFGVITARRAGSSVFRSRYVNLATGEVLTGDADVLVTSTPSRDGMFTFTATYTGSETLDRWYLQSSPVSNNGNYVGDGVSGIYIGKAMAGSGPYQRVTSQYDVTEAGVQTLHYLQFDGVDDAITSTLQGLKGSTAMVGVGYVGSGVNVGYVWNSSENATYAPDIAGAFFNTSGTATDYTRVFGAQVPSATKIDASRINTSWWDAPTLWTKFEAEAPQSAQMTVASAETTNPLMLGARSGGAYFTGKIFQLVAVKAAVSPETANRVSTFLNSKTGAY